VNLLNESNTHLFSSNCCDALFPFYILSPEVALLGRSVLHRDVHLHITTDNGSIEKHPTPLVFVHGAWHASWCWRENFIPFFAREGFTCHTFDFRGHGQSEGGESLHDYHVTDYVDDLGQVVETIKQTPVLIAHSMGGLVAQMFAQDHHVAGLVLLAPVPTAGVGYVFAKHPVALLKFLITRKGRAMISGEKLAKSLFFSSDIPDERFRSYYEKLQDESFTALGETGRGIDWKPLKGNPPLLIVEAGRDAVIPRTKLAETARLYGSEVVRLDTLAHDVMIDVHWTKTAELVGSWLSKSGF
jgi:pimeloyl-ACP methyl ester carboxylesterase